MSAPDRLTLCKRYFYLGFLGLPFLWLINGLWFGSYVFLYDQQYRSSEVARLRKRKVSPTYQDYGTESVNQSSSRRLITSTTTEGWFNFVFNKKSKITQNEYIYILMIRIKCEF